MLPRKNRGHRVNWPLAILLEKRGRMKSLGTRRLVSERCQNRGSRESRRAAARTMGESANSRCKSMEDLASTTWNGGKERTNLRTRTKKVGSVRIGCGICLSTAASSNSEIRGKRGGGEKSLETGHGGGTLHGKKKLGRDSPGGWKSSQLLGGELGESKIEFL